MITQEQDRRSEIEKQKREEDPEEKLDFGI